MGYFTSPGIDTILKGPTATVPHPKDTVTGNVGVNEFAHVSKRHNNHGSTTLHWRCTVYNVESQVLNLRDDDNPGPREGSKLERRRAKRVC